MTNEFQKPVKIVPAVVGQIADPDIYNQNIAGQSKGNIVPIDEDGNYGDGDIGDQTLGTKGALINNLKLRSGGFLKIYDADGVFIKNVSLDQATATNIGQNFIRKQITIANNASDSANDIDFSGGNFAFDDGSGEATVAAMTKRIDAIWSAGTNQGGLDTGTVSIFTPYYMFAIYNPTTKASDYLFSASSTSPTLPSGYTKKKRIAALWRWISSIAAMIWQFNPDGSNIATFNGFDDLTALTSVGTTSISVNVACPALMTGIFIATTRISGIPGSTVQKYVLFSPETRSTTNEGQIVATRQGNAFESSGAGSFLCRVASNSTIKAVSNDNNSNETYLWTRGWIDNILL